MRALMIFALLAVAGCATVNPEPLPVVAERCEWLGVSTENPRPMRPVVLEISGTLGTVAKHCGGDGPYNTKLGCIFESEPGAYTIVHSGRYSRYHEWCHSAFGRAHN